MDVKARFRRIARTAVFVSLMSAAASTSASVEEFKDPEFPPGYVQPKLGQMVRIAAGHYPVGDREGRGDTSETWFGTVNLSAFWIDVYPVTNREYQEFVRKYRRSQPRFSTRPELNRPLQPVVGVDWTDADAYCRSERKRLPSEFEWEVAARAGTRRVYPWGDEKPGEDGVWRANIGDGSLTGADARTYGEDGFHFPSPVGAFPLGINSWGLQDMAGNIWQWTATPFDYYVYRRIEKEPESRVPQIPDNGFRTARGGSWTNGPWSVRSSGRRGLLLGERTVDLGFRCAKDDPQ